MNQMELLEQFAYLLKKRVVEAEEGLPNIFAPPKYNLDEKVAIEHLDRLKRNEWEHA